MRTNLRIASLLVLIGIFGFSSGVLAQKAEKYNLVKVKSAKLSAKAFTAISKNEAAKSVLRAKKSNNTITALNNYSIYKVEGLNSAYVVLKSDKARIVDFQAYAVKTYRFGDDMVINIRCECSGQNDDCQFFKSSSGEETCKSLGGDCTSCSMTVETLFAPFK